MPADRPSRLHLWSAAVVLGVFLAGAAAGAGVTTWLRPRPPPRHGHGHGPGDLPPPIAALGLSPDQEVKARAILERHRPEFEAVLKESFPRLRALQDQVDQELKVILTEAQAKELDAQRVRRPPGPGGDHPRPPGMPGGPPGGEAPPR